MRDRVDRHAQDHRPDVLRRGRLEEVRAATGAVADVVADQVRDHRRVPGIVLRDTRLDLADEVRAKVGGLGVDTATELREQRDERRAKAEANDGERRFARLLEAAVGDEHHEHADERKSDHEDPGHRATAERDAERVADAVLGRGRRPQVRLHRDEHADDAGGHRADRADEEGDRRSDRELERLHARSRLEEVDDDADEDHAAQREKEDRAVLALDEGDGRDVDGAGDLLHLRRPDRRAEDVVREVAGHQDGDQSGERHDPKQGLRVQKEPSAQRKVNSQEASARPDGGGRSASAAV